MTQDGTVPVATAIQVTWIRIVAILAGAAFLLFGLWAFLAPRSFFDTLATYEPYNVHLVRDIGAFQIGLGAVLALVAFLRDAHGASLLGAGVGSAFHAVAHLMDRHLGGSPASDIPTFSLLAGALILAGFAHLRATARRA